MRVYLIMADIAYFGFQYAHTNQEVAVIDSNRDDVSVRGMAGLEGSYFSCREKEEPIFTDFGHIGIGNELILRVPQTEAVRPMLAAAGPIISMPSLHGMQFEAFVCETKLDALDRERLIYSTRDGFWTGYEVRRYAFRPEMVAEASVFYARGALGKLFATDRFIDLVEAHGLTGLRTLPIWSDTEGALLTIDRVSDEFHEFPPEPGNRIVDRRARMRAVLAARGG